MSIRKRSLINTLRLRQNGRHFPDDIFKCIFLNENKWITIKISLKFVPKGQINNIPALVRIMAWHRPGDKPFSEAMMVSLLLHICITRSQWVTSNGSWRQGIKGEMTCTGYVALVWNIIYRIMTIIVIIIIIIIIMIIIIMMIIIIIIIMIIIIIIIMIIMIIMIIIVIIIIKRWWWWW